MTKQPVYNIFKDGELIYVSGTLAQCTRVMADVMGIPDGVVMVADAHKAGFRLSPLP